MFKSYDITVWIGVPLQQEEQPTLIVRTANYKFKRLDTSFGRLNKGYVNLGEFRQGLAKHTASRDPQSKFSEPAEDLSSQTCLQEEL